MDQSADSFTQQTPEQHFVPPSPPKKSKKWLWIGLGAGVILFGAVAFNFIRVIHIINDAKSGKKSSSSAGGTTAAASKLYDALGNAVGQQKLRVAMQRTTYANKADADARQHKGSEQSSVATMDTTTLSYASVFAFNPSGEGGGISVGRCVNKVPYLIADGEAAGITTLSVAAERLKQSIPQVPVRGVSDSCARYGMAPGASVHVAWARLSDGIMPVTLEHDQAADWANKMKGTSLFAVTDEGMVNRNGEDLRKYAFKPKVESERVGVTLTEIFEQASNIKQLRRENPNATYDYAFIPLSATIASGAEGFYLINEKTNLPVYSEINTVAKDKTADGKAPSRLNLARTKQIYSYPSQVNITLNTPLEILE